MGADYSENFGPRRRKTFSPGSKVEPGLKARTKASLSTSVGRGDTIRYMDLAHINNFE
jgi:hypothetical protein